MCVCVCVCVCVRVCLLILLQTYQWWLCPASWVCNWKASSISAYTWACTLFSSFILRCFWCVWLIEALNVRVCTRTTVSSNTTETLWNAEDLRCFSVRFFYLTTIAGSLCYQGPSSQSDLEDFKSLGGSVESKYQWLRWHDLAKDLKDVQNISPIDYRLSTTKRKGLTMLQTPQTHPV